MVMRSIPNMAINSILPIACLFIRVWCSERKKRRRRRKIFHNSLSMSCCYEVEKEWEEEKERRMSKVSEILANTHESWDVCH